MNSTWQELADTLRSEAAEYGRLLGLFEEQQRTLFKRDPHSVLALGRAIQAQTEMLDELRDRRRAAVTAFAAEHGRPANATVRSLLDVMPAEARPLFEALILEINLLIRRVRRSSRLNHRLIGAVVECHQELMRRLRPDAFTRTYAANGRLSVRAFTRVPAISQAG